MRVPGRVYASDAMIADIGADRSPQQVINVATLPGIVGASLAMPDMHWGYGFPIGGVAAFDPDHGVLSPGGVGYDINCGVRLLRTELSRADIAKHLHPLSAALFKAIPCGVGSSNRVRLSPEQLEQVMVQGMGWCVANGYARVEDLETAEEHGCMTGACPSRVSERAKKRGRPQLGSLGSGNHFCEVAYVDEIYDPVAAEAYGLRPQQVTLMIHSGSRGFGHQICDDSLRTMLAASKHYGIDLSDRQLCAAPLDSDQARDYFAAMACAVNYAFANRQVMTQLARDAFAEFFGRDDEDLGMQLVYDVCHNIAKWETHLVDGQPKRVCVHRKGATRAFGPGHPDIPEQYRAVGQPVLVPGDMGRYSFVLAGTERAMLETFGSACHGAGRRLSRSKAKQKAQGRQLFQEMQARGVVVQAERKSTMAEEMPEAYKDVSNVVDVMHDAGIATRVAKLVPLAVIKG